MKNDEYGKGKHPKRGSNDGNPIGTPKQAAMDRLLAQLPVLLSEKGLVLKQKHGYKAGKLSAIRSWCQFVDGEVRPGVCLPNRKGQVKTWKLFARFDSREPPLSPWDQPDLRESSGAWWVISGDDVWGIAYEDVNEWAKGLTLRQLLERLASDLQVSFNYSRRHYC